MIKVSGRFVTRGAACSSSSCNVPQLSGQMTDILSYGTNELFEEVARHEEMGSDKGSMAALRKRGETTSCHAAGHGLLGRCLV